MPLTFFSAEDLKAIDSNKEQAELQDGTKYFVKHGTLYKQKISTKTLSPGKAARKAKRAAKFRSIQTSNHSGFDAIDTRGFNK